MCKRDDKYRIVGYAPGNPLLHGNLLHQEEVCDQLPGMLRELDSYNITFHTSFQGMDYEMIPELRGTLIKCNNFGVFNAPHNHGFLHHFSKKKSFIDWQTRDNIGLGEFAKTTFF